MSTSSNQVRKKRGALARRSSFHGGGNSGINGVFSFAEVAANRARTLPNLPFDRRKLEESGRGRMTKLLLNVTIQGSVGAVQVVMTMDSSVSDVVAASLAQYVKEMRRPILSTTDPSSFTLHYTQFNLESKPPPLIPGRGCDSGFFRLGKCGKIKEGGGVVFLVGETGIDGEEKVKLLGCRNFFLCSRRSERWCCSKEAARESSKIGGPWMRLMDFVFRAE